MTFVVIRLELPLLMESGTQHQNGKSELNLAFLLWSLTLGINFKIACGEHKLLSGNQMWIYVQTLSGRDSHDHECMVVGFTSFYVHYRCISPVTLSVPFQAHVLVYSIQLYEIQFVSNCKKSLVYQWKINQVIFRAFNIEEQFAKFSCCNLWIKCTSAYKTGFVPDTHITYITTNDRRWHRSVLHNSLGFPRPFSLVVTIKRKPFLGDNKTLITQQFSIILHVLIYGCIILGIKSQKCANCLLNTWLPRQLFSIILTNFDLCGFFSPNTAG
jgi:hypothetical protein